MSFARNVARGAIRANQAARAREAREAQTRARKAARAEANQAIREADRCVAWAGQHGTAEQLREAQAIADEWRRHRDQL
ncbi:MAG: hypothetical protein ACRDTT_30905 [Pseudonocardiaceae bacterium]